MDVVYATYALFAVDAISAQVSPEILTQAKNEAKSPNQSKAIFEYLWVGKV